MMPTLTLPVADGTLAPYTLRAPQPWPAPAARPPWNRVAFAAAHVVADPRARRRSVARRARSTGTRRSPIAATCGRIGFGVAEAMDTAQRGMGLDWPTSLELIRRSVAEARDIAGAVVFSGAGTDHLAAGAARTLDDVIAAYEEQCAAIEARRRPHHPDGEPRARARARASPDDYLRRLRPRAVAGARAGDPALARRRCSILRSPATGVTRRPASAGHRAYVSATVIRANAAKVDGIKVSLLDDAREIALRGAPAGRRAHVHRRRLQLRRADRRRRKRALRRAARHLRRDRTRRVGRADGAGARRPRGVRRAFSRRRCRCRATSSRRRRASTRPASCSWPGSTATSRTSRWWAGSRARAASCIWRRCSGSPTPPDLLRDPELAATRMRTLLAVNGIES